MNVEQMEGSGAAICFYGLIAEASQPCRCDPTNARVIFDDEYGFRSSRQGNFVGGAQLGSSLV